MFNNGRALSPEELRYLKEKYIFDSVPGYVVTSCKGYNRKVLHDSSKSFSLNTPIRKITITKDAIDFWLNEFREDYSPIEVQNAITALALTYQEITSENIKKVLIRGTSSVKII